jgi:hypothetical protein
MQLMRRLDFKVRPQWEAYVEFVKAGFAKRITRNKLLQHLSGSTGLEPATLISAPARALERREDRSERRPDARDRSVAGYSEARRGACAAAGSRSIATLVAAT